MFLRSKQPKQYEYPEQYQPYDVNQQKSLTRRARPAIAHFTIPGFLDTRSRTLGLRTPAPVGHAIHPANRVWPEAFHRAHIRFPTRRADVIFWLIGRKLEQTRLGSGGGDEKGGEENGDDEN